MFPIYETQPGYDVKDVGLKLKTIRNEAGLSVRAMAEALGMPASTYATREAETKRPFLPMEWAIPIADILEKHGIDRYRVLHLAGQDAGHHPANEVEVVAWVQAGSWCENNEIHHDERRTVLWPFKGDVPKGTVALEVRGDSMDVIYPDGSIVFAQDPISLSECHKAVRAGDIVVARRRNGDSDYEYTLKELAQKEDGSFMLLPRSRNLVHQPLPYEPVEEWYIGHLPDDGSADSLCIVGVVLGGLVGSRLAD